MPSRTPGPRLKPWAVPALFALSGMAALLQEIGWSELLARTLGHGTAAISLVTAAFLSGLAAGAAWGGRLAAASQRPLAAYAALEGAVAAIAVPLALGLPRLPMLTAALAGEALIAHDGYGLTLRASVAGMVLLPATFLMGATLPVLARALAADATAAGRVAGRLSGSNALGGGLGALLALLLLPALGTRLTLLAAAGCHALALLGALLLQRHLAAPPATPEAEPAPRDGSADSRLPALLLLLAGASALIAQIAWTRAFSWLLGSTVYTFGLVLAVIIAGYGVGGHLGAQPAARSRSPLLLFCRWQLAAAAAMALSIALLAGHPARVAVIAATLAHRPLAFQAAGLALVTATILPAAACLGAAFPVACRIRASRAGIGPGVGGAAAWITLGNVLGALLGGSLLPAWLGTRGCLLLAAGMLAAVALLAWPRAAGMLPKLALAAAVAAAMLLLPSWKTALMASDPAGHGPAYAAAAAATGEPLPQVMESRGPLLFAAESGDGLITVRRLPAGHASLQINGRTEASTAGDLPAQILAAHLPLLHARSPRRVLVVGLASGVTAGSALSHDPSMVVVVELAPTVIHAARSGPFDAASGRPWDDPRVRIVAADARNLLLYSPQSYDVIASQPSNPWVPGVAGLYTIEFYRLVRSRLQPGGVFGQWVQGYGMSLADLERIARTFAAAFPHAALFEEAAGGGDYFLIGSDEPMVEDAADWDARLTPKVAADLARAGVDGLADLLARRLMGRQGLVSFAGAGPLETDDRLRLAWSTPLSRGSQTTTAQSRALEPFRAPLAAGLEEMALDPERRRALEQALVLLEAERRRDSAMLALLDDEALDRLATPAVGEAVALARAGLFRAAYAMLLPTLESEPAAAALQVLAGDLAVRIGESGLAEVHFRAALQMRPDAAAADAGLGALLLGRGETDAARAHLEAAVRAMPDAARVWSNLGVARRRSGAPAESEAAYRRALEIDPSLGEAWYNLGVLLVSTGRSSEAADVFLRGLAVDPGDCDAARSLRGLQVALPAATALLCHEAAVSPRPGEAPAASAADAPPALPGRGR